MMSSVLPRVPWLWWLQWRWKLVPVILSTAASYGWDGKDILRSCASDIGPMPAIAWDHKGLTVEDTTLMYCTDKVPEIWPNTLAPVRTLRIFRAWHQDWWQNPKVSARADAWDNLHRYAVANGAKILLGTQVTCQDPDGPDTDEVDFAYAMELASMLGPERVFGFAVGNEIDLLYKKMKDDRTVTDDCIRAIWSGGKYWEKFVDRVNRFDGLGPGFSDIPVTAVFSAAALGGWPFQEDAGKALVNSFFRNATRKYGRRFVFTFNHYAYFDDNLQLDPGSSHCTRALKAASCWTSECMTPLSMADARMRMTALTGKRDYLYWVGETGWSHPQPKTLGTAMAQCRNWSSMETFERFYRGFLAWDLSVPGEKPPDHVFYFSIRTSLNFGFNEYFGLMDQCSNTECKIIGENFTEPVPEMQKQQRLLAEWRTLGFIALGILITVSLVGSVIYVTLLPSSWKGQERLRTLRRYSGYDMNDSMSSASSSDSEHAG